MEKENIEKYVKELLENLINDVFYIVDMNSRPLYSGSATIDF